MIIDVQHLTVKFRERIILNDISLSVPKGSVTAIVGESGSGKTTLALSLMGLLPQGMVYQAQALTVCQHSLLTATAEEQRRLRMTRLGFIFQEPGQAFDPLFTIGAHMNEVLQMPGASIQQRQQHIIQALIQAGLPQGQDLVHRYPHQLSGGQRQRAMLALACLNKPDLLIADEPTSSLDVLLQAQMIAMFKQLNHESGMSLLIVTHDLGLVAALADHVMVLKQGKAVEYGLVKTVIKNPQHAYTKQLVEASR